MGDSLFKTALNLYKDGWRAITKPYEETLISHIESGATFNLGNRIQLHRLLQTLTKEGENDDFRKEEN